MTPSELARFEAKYIVEPNSGCWLWDGCVNSRGYGQLRVFRDGRWRAVLAHRLSFEHFNGPIPPGLDVCHRCDVPACCNPAHLWLGTHADNLADMTAKGRRINAQLCGEAVPGARLSEKAVAAIRAEPGSYKSIAHKYRVSPATVGQVKRRDTWRHVP